MDEYLKLHNEKKKERTALNVRREKDYKLVTSYEYVMRDAADHKIKGMIHATTNRLKVFKSYVLASLAKADERIVVETEDEAFDTAEVEDFSKRFFQAANLKRFKRGQFAVEAFLDEQSCMTGELATRVVCQDIGGVLDVDVTPWDAQYITPVMGAEGLSQIGYETVKSKDAIESEPWAQEIEYKASRDELTEVEIWTPEENLIYVGEEQVYWQKNIYGFVPVCVQGVPLGTMMVAQNGLEYQMESIFFLVRGLIDEYNRCLSILQTHNLLTIKPALTEVGEKAHEYDDLADPGSVTPVDAPNAVQMVPYGEARRSMILALQEINNALDDGTLSRIMLGHIDVTEMSAVALVQVEQGQGQVYMPRLGSRGLEKKQITEMGIRQLQTLELTSFELGVPGHKKTFSLNKLEGEYEIDFRYTNKSPETDFARLSMATQYKASGLMDDLTILEDVMKRDDPEGDLRKVHRQNARGMSPTLQMYDTLMALSEMYEDGDESAAVEIDILEAELGVNIDQILSGNLPQAQQKEQPPTAQPGLLPTGEKSSPKKAADLKASPQEEE